MASTPVMKSKKSFRMQLAPATLALMKPVVTIRSQVRGSSAASKKNDLPHAAQAPSRTRRKDGTKLIGLAIFHRAANCSSLSSPPLSVGRRGECSSIEAMAPRTTIFRCRKGITLRPRHGRGRLNILQLHLEP